MMFLKIRSFFVAASKSRQHDRPTRRPCNIRLSVEHLEQRQLLSADVPGTMSAAHNLGTVQAQSLVFNESISNRHDVDMYRVEVAAGQQIGFDIDTPLNGPPGLGSYLRIFDSMGRQLAANNDRLAPDDPPPGSGAGSAGFDSYIPYRFDTAGTYYVGVSNWLNSNYDPQSGTSTVNGSLWTTGPYSLVVRPLNNVNTTVRPQSIAFRTDGSIEVGYQVTIALPANSQVPISVFWSKGGTGQDALPSGTASTAIFTHIHRGSSGPGSYRFTIPANRVTTAHRSATHLLVVAYPESNLSSTINNGSIYSIAVKTGNHSATQLRTIMPQLSQANAARLVGPLNQTLWNHGITSLEQRAMFLAQLAHESQDLTLWLERHNGSSAQAYFIQKYWVSSSQWSGLGNSVPTVSGLRLVVPAPPSSPPTKAFRLYFAKGPSFQNSASLITTLNFIKSNGVYTAQFAGAIPPALTTHLLIVDPAASNRVVAAIRNSLGNWRPQDAVDFRGRGPIQLTGRFNYQLFANYARRQDIMTNPALVSNTQLPEIGMMSAGWFWQVQNNRNLNETTNASAGTSSDDFTRRVTAKINPKLNGLTDRLTRYRHIRASLFR